MNGESRSYWEYLLEYVWIILIVMIVAAALYALGIFNPATYMGEVEQPQNCSELYAPADVVFVKSINNIMAVQHFKDDSNFLNDMRSENVKVYCWGALRCGAFNNLGVLHWQYADCDMN